MTDTTPTVHPFEASGLGKAPFTYVGAFRAEFRATPDAPVQCGTSCDFCGSGLMNAFRVKGSDGREFKVGCNCVMRVDPRLWAAHLEDLRAQRRAARDEAYASARRDREAQEAARRAKTAEDNVTALAMVFAGLAIVLAWSGLDAWTRDLLTKAQADLTDGIRGGLTSLEWEKLSIAFPVAYLPESRHFGKVGDRVKGVVAYYEGGPIIGLDDYSQYGPSHMAKFRTAAGELLVWKTSTYRTVLVGFSRKGYEIHKVALGTREAPIMPGTWVVLTGTIKSHSSYQGQAQTFVTRCKVTA